MLTEQRVPASDLICSYITQCRGFYVYPACRPVSLAQTKFFSVLILNFNHDYALVFITQIRILVIGLSADPGPIQGAAVDQALLSPQVGVYI